MKQYKILGVSYINNFWRILKHPTQHNSESVQKLRVGIFGTSPNSVKFNDVALIGQINQNSWYILQHHLADFVSWLSRMIKMTTCTFSKKGGTFYIGITFEYLF